MQVWPPGHILVAPAWQAPVAVQVLASVSVEPVQLPGLHTVAAEYLRQLPWPSQLPSRPQVAGGSTSHSLSGSSPALMGVHLPSAPATSQAWQRPLQGRLQQKASTHRPDWHWPPAMQAAPLARRGASGGWRSGARSGGRAASGGRGDGVSLGGSASPGRSASGSMGGASRRSPASGPVVVSGTSIPVSSPGAASSSGEDGPLRGRSSG